MFLTSWNMWIAQDHRASWQINFNNTKRFFSCQRWVLPEANTEMKSKLPAMLHSDSFILIHWFTFSSHPTCSFSIITGKELDTYFKSCKQSLWKFPCLKTDKFCINGLDGSWSNPVWQQPCCQCSARKPSHSRAQFVALLVGSSVFVGNVVLSLVRLKNTFTKKIFKEQELLLCTALRQFWCQILCLLLHGTFNWLLPSSN